MRYVGGSIIVLIVVSMGVLVAMSLLGRNSFAAGKPDTAMPRAPRDDAVQEPKDSVLILKLSATGDQIFVCTKVGEGYDWVVKPDATLFNESKEKAGKHYAGPTWKLNDGSKIVCKKVAETKKDGACALLLLKVTEHGGNGTLNSVEWVLRLNTTGGVKPAQAADAGNLGKEIRVPYTADYHFYGAKK